MIIDTRVYDSSRLGRVVGAEEMRKAQLEMLDTFAEFCDAHGLVYYLSGGTLLGAVRHKGFIPWDDDIDVNMPRPDFEKLLELTDHRLNDHLEIAAPLTKVNHAVSFPRIYDTRYILNSSSKDGKSSYYTNLFVDIFPIEGLPSGMKKIRFHYVLAKSFIIMRKLAYFKGVSGPMRKQKILRYAMYPVAKLTGWNFWNRLLLKLSLKYKYDECELVGVTTGGMHTLEEIIKREGYGKPAKVEFEGKLYNAPANTHKYLSNLYGDYMQLPPEEKRVSHHTFTVYESKEER